MKQRNLFITEEKGQVLVIVVILLFALVAMTALLTDGGIIMLSRRQAQVAADAGALAGARRICKKDSEFVVRNTASEYVARNKATLESVSFPDNNQVTVNTSVSRDSFFARIFNINTLRSRATATAECLFPANNSLPITFFCPDPSAANDCGVDMFDWEGTHTPNSTKYLIVQVKTSGQCDLAKYCVEGGMNCDVPIDSEGYKVEVLGDGQPAWIPDICGRQIGPCVNDILNGKPVSSTIIFAPPPTDVVPGDRTDFFISLGGEDPGRVYLLPFYDSFTTKNACSSNNTLATLDTVNLRGAVHFMADCLTKNFNETQCAGKNAWQSVNPGIQARSMEGFFVKNYPVDISNPGSGGVYNMGTYYVSLIK